MKYRSGLVNERHEDKIALQIVARQGHTWVLDMLMEAGADTGLRDRSVSYYNIIFLFLLCLDTGLVTRLSTTLP